MPEYIVTRCEKVFEEKRIVAETEEDAIEAAWGHETPWVFVDSDITDITAEEV